MRHTINRSKFLQDHELSCVVSQASLQTRDGTMIILAIESGIRANELLALTKLDLYDDTSSIFIKALKNGLDREIPLRPELYAAVKQFVPFGIKYRRLDQIWSKYNIKKRKFHSLRHTFAINLYKRTRDIKLVQLALGHRSPSSTSVYIDFIYNQEEMKRILIPDVPEGIS